MNFQPSLITADPERRLPETLVPTGHRKLFGTDRMTERCEWNANLADWPLMEEETQLIDTAS
jgi:hypothetical protein